MPQFLIFFTLFIGYEWYVYGHLAFPHPGGLFKILMLGFLTVVAAQGFGVFIFGLMPSLRMSMSVCSLWAVVGFSACGATYPVFSMDSMIEGASPKSSRCAIISWCIRQAYSTAIPSSTCGGTSWLSWRFALLPMLTARNIKKAMLEYVYIP